MTKALFALFGLVLLGLGVWGAAAWSAAVLIVLKALVVLAAILAGLAILVFAVSDLRAAEPPSEVAAPPANSTKAA